MSAVLVLRQSHFPLDPRVRREVTALVDAGYDVDVLCTRGSGEPLVERAGRLRTFRLPLWHRQGGTVGYLLEYVVFLGVATLVAGVLHARRRYRLIQVHTLPDPLVFAGLIPKRFGARILLDLHECMPEFFATKFGVRLDHPLVRLLGWIEQRAIRFSDHAITCTEQMREAFIGRGAAPSRLDVVLNSADEQLFDPDGHSTRPRDHRFVVVSHGALEERYGLDVAIRAIALLAPEMPGLVLEIYGEGSERDALVRLAAELGVANQVVFSDGYVPIDQLVAAIARADAGLVAIRRDAFRDLTHCNKMYDFVAMQKPVVASVTASAAAYFDENCFAWFESGDPCDLARAIRRLCEDRAWSDELVARASERAQPYRWSVQRQHYLKAVETALGG